jgi:hypothetical protein
MEWPVIRYTIDGQKYEVRPRRAVGFVLAFMLFCLVFDTVYTTNMWVAAPVETAFGLYLDWLMPTFRLWGHICDARRLHRELRKLRSDRVNCGPPRFESEPDADVAQLELLVREGADAARWAVVECTYCRGWHVAPTRGRWWR